MNFIKLTCSNCNAQLDVDMDNMQLYCPYCGQKLLFNLRQMDKVLSEKEKTKREQEKTKRVQMEYEYKENKEKRDNALFGKVMLGLVIFLILDFAFLFFEGERTLQEHKVNNEIKVSVSSEDLDGIDYKDAERVLRASGFSDIELIKKNDLIFGLLSKDGEVASVSINGITNFTKGEWFPADASVKVTYHAYKKDG